MNGWRLVKRSPGFGFSHLSPHHHFHLPCSVHVGLTVTVTSCPSAVRTDSRRRQMRALKRLEREDLAERRRQAMLAKCLLPLFAVVVRLERPDEASVVAAQVDGSAVRIWECGDKNIKRLYLRMAQAVDFLQRRERNMRAIAQHHLF